MDVELHESVGVIAIETILKNKAVDLSNLSKSVASVLDDEKLSTEWSLIWRYESKILFMIFRTFISYRR